MRWVAQQTSWRPSASVRSGTVRVVSASPCGLSGPIGGCAVSTMTTVLSGPSTSMSSRATMKCWWIGAYVDTSTTVPYGGGSPANGVVTMIPVARTSQSIPPSSKNRQ